MNNVIKFEDWQSKINDKIMQQVENNGNNEVQLADGIYFQDFRNKTKSQKEQQIIASKCVDPNMIEYSLFKKYHQIKLLLKRQQHKYKPHEDPNLLDQDYKDFKLRIEKLQETIEILMKEENWEDEKDYIDAIDEDFDLIDRTYKDQIQILLRMRDIDRNNKLLQTNFVEEIEALIQKNLDKKENYIQHLITYNDNLKKELLKEINMYKQQMQENEDQLHQQQKIQPQEDNQNQIQLKSENQDANQQQINVSQQEEVKNNDDDDDDQDSEGDNQQDWIPDQQKKKEQDQQGLYL